MGNTVKQLTLRPQDVVVLLKIALIGDARWTFSGLGKELSLPQSEVHASFRRILAARLVSEGEVPTVARQNLREFVLHGVRYAFPPIVGPIAQGIPTAEGGPTLSKDIVARPEGPHVWPSPSGSQRGPSLVPLYPKAPVAAAGDPELYDLLTLIDALRVGAARERELASREIGRRLS